MDVVGAFFAGVLSALSNIDSSSLIQGIAAVGLLTALVAALRAVSGLIPAELGNITSDPFEYLDQELHHRIYDLRSVSDQRRQYNGTVGCSGCYWSFGTDPWP